MKPPANTPDIHNGSLSIASADIDKPMTIDQADLLRVLCESASEPFNKNLTQGEAIARIAALRRHLNRVQNL